MEIRLSIALKKDREGTDPIQVTSDVLLTFPDIPAPMEDGVDPAGIYRGDVLSVVDNFASRIVDDVLRKLVDGMNQAAAPVPPVAKATPATPPPSKVQPKPAKMAKPAKVAKPVPEKKETAPDDGQAATV